MLKILSKLILFTLLIASSVLLYQKHTYAYHTLLHVNPIPHTQKLIEASHYADAYAYLHYFIQFDYVKNNSQAQSLMSDIKEKRDSLTYQSEKIIEGIRTGTSDEVLGQASAIGSDFFVVGDIRDLFIEVKHYFKDEKVDTLLVALSSIGLVATAGTLFTGGASGVAKAGISTLKLAQKSKCIPTWLRTFIIKQSKQIRQTRNLASITPLLNKLETLRKRIGLAQTLKLLSQTSSLKELTKLTKLSKRYGKETASLLKVSNRQILTHAEALKKMDIQTIKVASSYGENGITHLLKHGEKNFLKTTQRLKSYAKVGYKGEVWKIVLWSMKHISDTILFMMMAITSLGFIPWRRILSPLYLKK